MIGQSTNSTLAADVLLSPLHTPEYAVYIFLLYLPCNQRSVCHCLVPGYKPNTTFNEIKKLPDRKRTSSAEARSRSQVQKNIKNKKPAFAKASAGEGGERRINFVDPLLGSLKTIYCLFAIAHLKQMFNRERPTRTGFKIILKLISFVSIGERAAPTQL